MADLNYPEDLRDLQRRLHQARAGLTALCARLPHRPMPMPEPYTDYRGVRHPASPGWTQEDQAEVDALWARQRGLAAAVVEHAFWSTLDGGVADARTALKHHDGGVADRTER